VTRSRALKNGYKSMWHGQHHEDERIARLLGSTDDCCSMFFYELGANGPHVDSISRWFYDRGAMGIAIEAVPFWHKQLVENRPRDINLNCAVGEFPESSRTMYVASGTGLSTLVSGHDFGPYENYKIEVQVRTLRDIYEQHPCPPNRQFGWASIDCEGWEAPIIRGTDWNLFRPRVMCIESDHGYHEWEPILLTAGYEFVEADTANRFYRRLGDH
jgi:FkbM family methyltransferase